MVKTSSIEYNAPSEFLITLNVADVILQGSNPGGDVYTGEGDPDE